MPGFTSQPLAEAVQHFNPFNHVQHRLPRRHAPISLNVVRSAGERMPASVHCLYRRQPGLPCPRPGGLDGEILLGFTAWNSRERPLRCAHETGRTSRTWLRLGPLSTWRNAVLEEAGEGDLWQAMSGRSARAISGRRLE
jgi:hypothetical protein